MLGGVPGVRRAARPATGPRSASSGCARIALALDRAVRRAAARGVHRTRPRVHGPGHAPDPRPPAALEHVYQPMLELIAELRRLDFTVCVVTGGGTEFVRAVSQELYGVPPEAVVGTPDRLRVRPDRGRRRVPGCGVPTGIVGGANEGAAKVDQHPDPARPPTRSSAAGNSGGDREMLEWAAAGDATLPGAAGRPRRRGPRVQLRQHGRDLRRARADHRGRRRGSAGRSSAWRTTGRPSSARTSDRVRSAFRCFGREQVEPEPLGQVLGDELAAHAVPGGIQRRREGRQSALPGEIVTMPPLTPLLPGTPIS